ncbi:cell surface glycoprotein CD200 receptor 1-A isoform X2 [Myxocyprinus asiaticus]|uniref:cell surface glycoprotein CD200 receptor 1-A isoform X2 n=1 Tax=Myxocyprinus asiaticus TaxID=70543 RepID=UPI0022235EFB|nr:cell surface glycoprotein CD200 receptor 1-A isoform X2 [Myxocyprinus asiaticus]
MTNNRTLTMVVLLSIFVARSHTRVFKAETFMEGNNVTLKCGDAKVKWNELIFITWNLSLQSRKCFVGMLLSKPESTCNDGKMLLNSSNRVSLFIPKISKDDEGSYSCDISYSAGTYAETVNVSVGVPNLVSKLEFKNGQWYAVCEAKYEQSVPTLRWEPALNFFNKTSNIIKGDMTFVKNRVNLLNVVNVSSLTCVATNGTWQQNITLDLTKLVLSDPKFPWEIIAIAVSSVCFIIVSLAVVYVLRRKFNNLSALKTLCCKSKISTPAEDKPTQAPDVEEVEPYASYIQRVNSIYNSSAELFNA